MLSPNRIPAKRTHRASSTWSNDSGYGSGIHEDAKLSCIVGVAYRDLLSGALAKQHQLGSRDIASARIGEPLVPQPVSLGIYSLAKLQLYDQVAIKEEEHGCGFDTPRLRVCTALSTTSSTDTVSPASPASPVEVRRSRAGKSSKLPSQAVSRLNAWLDANRHHPYPDAETKQALADNCGITVKQVTTWFTNTRQRQLKSQETEAPRLGDGDDQTPIQTSRKGKKKDYRRSNGASPIDDLLSPPQLSPYASNSDYSAGEGENWQCTFCNTSLTSKSWRRHEETQHHPKYQWTCLAFGPQIPLPSCSSSICAFCELQNPDEDHFQRFHRIGDCLCKDAKERTFGRPDHLQQHAKNFHKVTQPLSELVRDTWRIDGPGLIVDKIWPCGFCQELLYTWDTRQTHIAMHFKSGSTMTEWRTSQSTRQGEHSSLNESAALDALASMGTTIAGPSTHRPYQVPQTNIGAAQSLELQSASTTTFMPASAGIPDLEFDPFYGWGNSIDTFVPSTTDLMLTYPHASMMPTATQGNGASSVDYVCVGFDQYGSPIYERNAWNL
ncbi:uncharacterized protein EKO05_0003378 [Ascochyta rabiei]|uniref:DNA binding n=1 Tax=Didymella rabiei TaxID=5454 RepID=A0A162YFP6_DIDRA|nr:uncharacterized protein EKO05_0003378 [Ascochyta rabiei]KZM20013.1 DNA binding [Ascochyta rabiei]UPX12843.1 hypothetical protein EKO05_0003378 [Ascochyta rabiei]